MQYQIVIQVSHTEEVSDYDSLVTIDTATLISNSKMRDDCSDIMFLTMEGSTVDFFIESGCNTEKTKIFVRHSIPETLTTKLFLIHGIESGYEPPEKTFWGGNETKSKAKFSFFRTQSCPSTSDWSIDESYDGKYAMTSNSIPDVTDVTNSESTIHAHSTSPSTISLPTHPDDESQDVCRFREWGYSNYDGCNSYHSLSNADRCMVGFLSGIENDMYYVQSISVHCNDVHQSGYDRDIRLGVYQTSTDENMKNAVLKFDGGIISKGDPHEKGWRSDWHTTSVVNDQTVFLENNKYTWICVKSQYKSLLLRYNQRFSSTYQGDFIDGKGSYVLSNNALGDGMDPLPEQLSSGQSGYFSTSYYYYSYQYKLYITLARKDGKRTKVDHTHKISLNVENGDEEPLHREVQYCQAEKDVVDGFEDGMISFFNKKVSLDGWTELSQENSLFKIGSGLGMGGSSEHSHSITWTDVTDTNSITDDSGTAGDDLVIVDPSHTFDNLDCTSESTTNLPREGKTFLYALENTDSSVKEFPDDVILPIYCENCTEGEEFIPPIGWEIFKTPKGLLAYTNTGTNIGTSVEGKLNHTHESNCLVDESLTGHAVSDMSRNNRECKIDDEYDVSSYNHVHGTATINMVNHETSSLGYFKLLFLKRKNPETNVVIGEENVVKYCDGIYSFQNLMDYEDFLDCGDHGNCKVTENYESYCECEGYWDGELCDRCLNSYFNENCTACSEIKMDLSTNCTSCLGNFKPPLCTNCIGAYYGTNCENCPANYDSSCTECEYGYDINYSCSQCKDKFNSSNNCKTCINHYQGDDCQECPSNFNEDCTACILLGGADVLDLSNDCQICQNPNYGIAYNCTGCGNNWYGLGCSLCPENYDSDCLYCINHYSEESNCTKCKGNWELETSNCTTCLDYWYDEENECGSCPPYFNEECTECEGPNFDFEDLCLSCINHFSFESRCTKCEGYYTGDDCNECMPNFNVLCTACRSNWDITKNCTVCKDFWYGSDCQYCGNNYNDNCTACKTEAYDGNQNCEACIGNFDYDTDCTKCIGFFNGEDCTDCPANFKSNCLECEGNYDISTNCTTCLSNFDLSNNCETCLGYWIGENCSICPSNFNDDCTSCSNNWQEPDKNCSICPGNWNSEDDCNSCINKYDKTKNCETCKTGFSISSNCTKCINRWTGVNCDYCPGNINETNNCKDCTYQWVDNSDNCGTCPGNWDRDTNCRECQEGYTIESNCTEEETISEQVGSAAIAAAIAIPLSLIIVCFVVVVIIIAIVVFSRWKKSQNKFFPDDDEETELEEKKRKKIKKIIKENQQPEVLIDDVEETSTDDYIRGEDDFDEEDFQIHNF